MVTVVIVVLMIAVSAGVGVIIVKAAHILPEKDPKRSAKKQTGKKRQKKSKGEAVDVSSAVSTDGGKKNNSQPSLVQEPGRTYETPEKIEINKPEQPAIKEVPSGTIEKYRTNSPDASATRPAQTGRQAGAVPAATRKVQPILTPVESVPASQMPRPIRKSSANRVQSRANDRNRPEMSGSYMGFSGDEVQHFRRAELLDLIEDQQEQIETLEKRLEQKDAAMQRYIEKNQDVDRALQMVDIMVQSINDSRDASVHSLQNLSAVLEEMRLTSGAATEGKRRRRRQE